MELDQRAMCPKHGIAHGVCVDPVPVGAVLVTERTPMHSHVPDAEINDESDLQLADPPPSLAKAMKAMDESIAEDLGLTRDLDVEQPCTAPSRCVVHNPNRFDPYEALDEIERTIRENAGSIGLSASEDRLVNGLYALRAYITGMEK